MDSRGMSLGFANCKYVEDGECCFRKYDPLLSHMAVCNALCNTRFEDGHCHFRKKTKDGPNEYDLMRKRQKATALTFGYVVDKLRDKYGIRERGTEAFSLTELSAYIEDIYKEFAADVSKSA